MKKLRLITGLSIVFCFVVVVSVHSQEWIINPANGHGYMVVEERLEQPQAEGVAKSLGCHLVTINNQKENDWIVKDLLPNYAVDQSRLWIGLYWSTDEFHWYSSEDIDYFNWISGAPHDETQDYKYVYMNYQTGEDTNGKWSDGPKANYASIIETYRTGDNNLLKNPGAEEGTEGWNIIDGSVGTDNSHLNHNAVEGNLFFRVRGTIEQSINISPNNESNDLVVSLWISIGSTISAVFLNESKEEIGQWSQTTDAINAWKMYDYQTPIPEETRFISFSVTSNQNECFVDDIFLTIFSRPESTQTPTPTLTPTSTPTPTAPPPYYQPFEGTDLPSNQLVSDPPAGFISGNVRFGDIPEGTGTDGNGMSVDLFPGNGNLIISLEPVEVNGLAHISGQFKASTSNVSLALIALNSPIDGQLAYVNLTEDEVPLNEYRRFDLYYAPPSGKLQVAVQVVNSPFSTLSATVWVDNLIVEPPSLELGKPVTLEVDGTFEGELENLIVNMNNVDGAVIPFFESLTDIAIRMSVEPSNMAANIGTIVTGVEEHYPFTLIGEVIKRSGKRHQVAGD